MMKLSRLERVLTPPAVMVVLIAIFVASPLMRGAASVPGRTKADLQARVNSLATENQQLREENELLRNENLRFKRDLAAQAFSLPAITSGSRGETKP